MESLQEQRDGALARHQRGDHAGAERRYHEILAQHPTDGETWHYLAVLRGQQGRPVDVVRCCREALRHGFRRASVYSNLGLAERELGHDDAAASALQEATALDADDPLLVQEYAELLRALARERDALGVLRNACGRFSGNADLHAQFGELAAELNDGDAAGQAFEAAVRAAPDAAQHRVNLGNVQVMRGDNTAAETAYRQALCIMPDFDEASWYLAQLVDARTDQEFAAAVIERAGRPVASPAILFAAGKVHDDCGRVDQAFGAYAAGNRKVRESFDYSVASDVDTMARLAASSAPAAPLPAPRRSGPTPVFLVGMPRSGSTLLEQMLGAHPAISAGGEIVWFQRLLRDALRKAGKRYPQEQCELSDDTLLELQGRYADALHLRSDGASFVTDKLPGNFLCIPTIRRLFPDALIVHVRRDPLQTCWSCFRHLFTGQQRFAYELGELGTYHRAAGDLIDAYRGRWPGQILESRYERLIEEPEATLRAMLGRLGLGWDSRCLLPQATRNVVMTASASQLRQGLAAAPRQGAAAYARHLGPLTRALGLAEQSSGASP